MTSLFARPVLLAAAIALAGCATTALPGPVEVTRYHDAGARGQLAEGTIFVETGAGSELDGLELSPYKEAVARELAALGYTESAREAAGQLAQLRVERYRVGIDGGRRGPVSVGVGGSTGSYGSGVGVGLGINLGGGGSRERIGTDLALVIRDAASSAVLWEGRARFEAPRGSDYVEPRANAAAIAAALLREFPGNNSETVEIAVDALEAGE